MSLLELEPAVEVESKVELLSEEEYGEYVSISIERSIAELDSGLGIPHEEVEKRLKKWLE